MRLNIVIVALFCICNFSFSQSTLIVGYTHSTHIEGLPSETTVNASLMVNKNYSLYEMDYLNNKSFINEENGDQGVVLSIKPSKNPLIYKVNNAKSIYSIERISMTPFLVKDTYAIFKWKITKNEKTILKYKCQEALVDYRGRSYIVYFTTNIPFNGGPWKFSGLPGLILEIKSTDGVFHIIANKLQIKNNTSSIVFPFEIPEKKAITWDNFIAKYKQKYEELLHYRNEDGGTMSIPKRKIEVLIED